MRLSRTRLSEAGTGLKRRPMKRLSIPFLFPAVSFAAILACSACTAAVQDTARPASASVAAAPAAVSADRAERAGSLSFLATGDMLLTRLPGKRMAQNGVGYLFEKVKPLVEAADIAFGNLECPISTGGSPYPNKPENVTFRALPEAAEALSAAGYDLVSLANNHMNDYGESAVADTLRYLDRAGVATAGAGRSASESREAAILSRGGYTIAVLAYAEPVWSVVEARDPPWPKSLATLPARPSPEQIGPGRAGTAIVREDTLRSDIAKLKARGGIDIVAASFHWGEEHARAPNSYQRRIARLAIDSGADLVLGHHPHVLQGIELYNGGIILYSLGNYIFDMDPDATYDSVAVILRVDREESGDARIAAFELLPLRIARGLCRPAPAKGEDRNRISEFLVGSSEALGLALSRGSAGFAPLVEGEEWEPSLHWSRSARP